MPGQVVTLQPDGKILAAGNSDGHLGVVRYNADGSFDTTFGSGGKVITTNAQTWAVALYPNAGNANDGKRARHLLVAVRDAGGIGPGAVAEHRPRSAGRTQAGASRLGGPHRVYRRRQDCGRHLGDAGQSVAILGAGLSLRTLPIV